MPRQRSQDETLATDQHNLKAGKDAKDQIEEDEGSFMKNFCPYHFVIGSWRSALTVAFFARVASIMTNSSSEKHEIFRPLSDDSPLHNGTETTIGCDRNSTAVPDIAILILATTVLCLLASKCKSSFSAGGDASRLTVAKFLRNIGLVHLIFAGFGLFRCIIARPVALYDASLFDFRRTNTELLAAWEDSHPEVSDGDALSFVIRLTHVLRVYASLFGMFSRKTTYLWAAMAFIVLSVPVDNLFHRYLTPDVNMCRREQFLLDWDKRSCLHVFYHALTMIWVNMYTLVIGSS